MTRKRVQLVVAMLVLLALAVPQVFAGGQGESEGASDNPYGDFVRLKFFSASPNVPADDNRTVVWVEEKFNVDIQWEASPWGDYGNALSTKLAAGDIPDWFQIQGGSRHTMMDELIEDGIVINYRDYLDDYPNLKRYVDQEHPEIQILFGETNSNDLYAIPGFFGYQRHAPLYRKDWFDQLGLGVPDTWQDYKEALKKVMEADPEGTKPYGVSTFAIGFLENSLPAFTGRADSWYQKDGEWIYRAFDPGFKEWLAFWESMYDEGIMDPEWNLLKRSDVTSKFASGKIAATFNHINTVNWNIFYDPLMEANPDAEMALMIPYPAGPAGRYWVRNDGYFMAELINANSDEAVIRRALAIFDWNHTDEGEMTSTYGLEGVHYTIQNGEVVRDLEETNKDAGTPGGDQFIRRLGANPVLREQIEIPQIRANSQALAEYGVTNAVRIDIPLDVRSDWQDLNTRFSEANNEWYPKFFIGEADVADDYDDYLQALRDAGYEQMQDYFEKYGYVLDLGSLEYEMK